MATRREASMLEHDHPPAEHAHGRVPTWAVEALACADALYNLAHYLTGNVPDAEDLVQETYARAFHGADGFLPGTHLRAWLYRILKNAFVSDWRKWRRESLGTDEPGNSPAEEKRLFGDAELERLRGVLSGELQAALMALPVDGRMVILLHLEGLSEAQVAYALGCAAGTVKSRLSRSRATLRRKLTGASWVPPSGATTREHEAGPGPPAGRPQRSTGAGPQAHSSVDLDVASLS